MMPFIFALIFKTIYVAKNFIRVCGCALEGRKFCRRSRGDQGQGLQRRQSYLDTFSTCEKFLSREKRNFFRSEESEPRRLCFVRPMTTPVSIWCRYGERAASRFATRKLSLPKTLSAEGKGRSGEIFAGVSLAVLGHKRGVGNSPHQQNNIN